MNKLQIAIDLGNFELKFCSPGEKPLAIRSVRARITEGQRVFPRTDRLNPLLELNGVKWHLGWRVFDGNHQQLLTVEESKTDSALLSVLACIKPPAEEFSVDLKVSHPTPDFAQSLLKEILGGTHEYSYNGRRVRAEINQLTICEESLGSWQFVRQHHPELLTDAHSLLIDVGGGTLLTKLVDRDGNILFRQDFEKMGSYYLANRLSADARLYKAVGTQPDIGVIQNGFADGTHCYGKAHNLNISWFHYLDEYLTDWLRAIISKVKSAYAHQLSNVGVFLFTGGSSHLLREKLEGKRLMAFCPDLRFGNVLGYCLDFTPIHPAEVMVL